MAAAQQFHPYQQGKGTLIPGQTIVVNKHTIQVERYLSQGKLIPNHHHMSKILCQAVSPTFISSELQHLCTIQLIMCLSALRCLISPCLPK